MENNAVNAVRSTENTTKNQTTFRLGLHLSTAHGDSADTYADFNFAGSTPEEFDHALGTILDVVTDTVYGGQINGLREIMDRSTAEFMANAAEQEQPEEEAPGSSRRRPGRHAVRSGQAPEPRAAYRDAAAPDQDRTPDPPP